MSKVDTIKYGTLKLNVYDTGDVFAYDFRNFRSAEYVWRTAGEFKNNAVMLFRWNCGFVPDTILSQIIDICGLFQQ